jgi:hypothetical protein
MEKGNQINPMEIPKALFGFAQIPMKFRAKSPFLHETLTLDDAL